MQVESLPVDEGNQAKGARVFLLVWWRFFWRYAILWAALLLGGGNLLNLLSKFILDSSFLFSVTLIYSGTANVLASFLVFFYILNRPFKKSVAVLSTANGRSVFRTKLKSWFYLIFFWAGYASWSAIADCGTLAGRRSAGFFEILQICW